MITGSAWVITAVLLAGNKKVDTIYYIGMKID